MLSFASALDSQGVGIQNENFIIIQNCYDATFVTLSTIQYPNKTISIINENMTNLAPGSYGYNFTDTSDIGRYYVNGISDGCENSFTFYFDITYTGENVMIQEIFVYTIILLALFGLLIACFMYRKSLPEYNYDEEDGYVISVNKLAHLRPVLLGVGWILLLAIIYILSNISIAYISAEFIGNFMFAIWSIMMWSNLVILPIWVIYMLNDFIKKSKLKEFIERGGTIQNGQI